jgi:hypothetical protein
MPEVARKECIDNVSWFALLDLSDDYSFFNTKLSHTNVHVFSESKLSLNSVDKYSYIEHGTKKRDKDAMKGRVNGVGSK